MKMAERRPTWLAALCSVALWMGGVQLRAEESVQSIVQSARRAFEQQLVELSAATTSEHERRAIESVRMHRDPSRFYFFVPDARADDASADRPQQLAERCRAHGERLAELAQQAAALDEWGLAYQLAHETLLFAPEQPQMQQALGRVGRPAGRRAMYRSRVGVRPESTLGWPAGTYRLVATPHFLITTNDREDTAMQLADRLEQLHAVWEQLFFDCWSPRKAALSRNPLRFPRRVTNKRHQIVLFRSQEDYVATIRRIEPRAELTRGYYHPTSRTAFFIGGESPQISTWYHEATHQLFSELPTSTAQSGRRHSIWVIEGIAIYMESLQTSGAALTVGGLEASRLQHARFRALRERQHFPLEQLVELDQATLQQHEQIRGLYSQFAGMTHFLMHGESGRWRPALLKYLSDVYRDQATTATLSELTAVPYADLEQRYIDFLQVNDAQLAQLDPNATIVDLALGGTQISDDGLTQLADWSQLEWLDLFGTRVTDKGTRGLEHATQLRQLCLEGTQIGDETVARLHASQLEQLDLAQTPISDAALSTVGQMDKLESLWLTGTQITDAGTVALRRLVNLRTLDLSETRVSDAARNQLDAALPLWSPQP